MTDRALRPVNFGARAGIRIVGSQAAGPRHLIRVHVQHAAAWIDRGPTPLRSTVEAGKDDRLPIHAERDELPIAAKGPEFLYRPCMRRGRALGQHIFGQPLARVGRRSNGHRLFGRCLFPRNIARWIGMFLNGEKRRARHPIEEVDHSLLRRLRNRIH